MRTLTLNIKLIKVVPSLAPLLALHRYPLLPPLMIGCGRGCLTVDPKYLLMSPVLYLGVCPLVHTRKVIRRFPTTNRLAGVQLQLMTLGVRPSR